MVLAKKEISATLLDEDRRQSNPLANYALDKCEETFRKCEWNGFGRWYEIYLRELSRSSCFRPKPSDQN
jgi:hypothetical protein